MSEIAEKNLIGSILIDQENVNIVYGYVKPEMFTSRIAGAIYKGMLVTYDLGGQINIISCINQTECIEFSREDIQEYLKDSVTDLIHSAGIRDYAESIVNDYKVRQLCGIVGYMQSDLKASNVTERIGQLMNELENINSNVDADNSDFQQIAKELGALQFVETDEDIMLTGFERLDNALGNMEKGDVMVIAARPSVGKSAFANQIIEHATRTHLCALFSLEMSKRQVYQRFLARASTIPLQRVIRGRAFLNDEEQLFRKGQAQVESMKLRFYTENNIEKIHAICRNLKPDLIVVDYLQLVKTSQRYGNRTQEVGAISHALKAMAMELNTRVIVLSQLNRLSEGRADKEPTMSDLRESGDIEQDASQIVLLWNATEDKKYKGIKLDKNRQGENARYLLEFDGAHMDFKESDLRFRDVKGLKSIEDENPFV